MILFLLEREVVATDDTFFGRIRWIKMEGNCATKKKARRGTTLVYFWTSSSHSEEFIL